ncbi:MAG: hypothetical protein ACKO26_11190 [Planctomycetota bacterium]
MRAALVLFMSLSMVLVFCRAEDNPKEARKMEFTGKLATGIFAAGGETTGTILRAEKTTYELDFGKQKELRKKAESLNGKNVTVTGTLNIRKGVEVAERRIISVTALKEAVDK